MAKTTAIRSIWFGFLVVAFVSVFASHAAAQEVCEVPELAGNVRAFSASGPVRGEFAGFRSGLLSFMVNTNPGTFQVGDFTDLLPFSTRTDETHRLYFTTSILSLQFLELVVEGHIPAAMELRDERTGVSLFGPALIETPLVEEASNRISGLNAFAHKYLAQRPAGTLAFLEMGPVLGDPAAQTSGVDRDPNTNYFYVVEQVHHLTGAGSICSDTFVLTADIRVRVYTRPKPPLEPPPG